MINLEDYKQYEYKHYVYNTQNNISYEQFVKLPLYKLCNDQKIIDSLETELDYDIPDSKYHKCYVCKSKKILTEQ